MSAVQDFYTNKVMREDVRNYFLSAIESEAIELLFNRADTSHIADAKDLIDKIFQQMDIDFEVTKEVKSLNNQR